MCGIVRFDGKAVDHGVVRTMMSAIKHRGPDDEGQFTEGPVGLGFVRLSIIDLTTAGHQPMWSRDQRHVIVFNGEIFNYIELREELRRAGREFSTGSDTEVLLQAYQEWGPACLDRFNGMWAFAVFDRRDRSLFIARDRYGIKPLYYLHRDDFIAFASEIPALLELLPSGPQPDLQSVYDFLVYNRTDHSGATFFQEIKRLDHGRCLRIEACAESGSGGSPILPTSWYDLSRAVEDADPISDPTDFRELLTSSVALRLRSDVPVGVCLSGGLDSSSIVSLLVGPLGKTDLETFSAVYGPGEYGDESDFIEEYRSQVAHMFSTTPNATTLLDDLDDFVLAHAEPLPSTSPYAQYKVMELAKDRVVVTIDGQGADELLAGYHYFFGYLFKELLRTGRLLRLGRELGAYLREHRSTYGVRAGAFLMMPRAVREKLGVARRGYLAQQFHARLQGSEAITEGLHGSDNLASALIDHFEHKLEHLLKWEDRNSMWFSLEARVPFLDYRLVERVLATPSQLILKDGQTKRLLREAMRGRLPERIRVRRDKMGFGTPQDRWFRTPRWQRFIRELLGSASFRGRGIIDPAAASGLYERHVSGKSNLSKEIWKWVHLELWYRRFIDRAT